MDCSERLSRANLFTELRAGPVSWGALIHLPLCPAAASASPGAVKTADSHQTDPSNVMAGGGQCL